MIFSTASTGAPSTLGPVTAGSLSGHPAAAHIVGVVDEGGWHRSGTIHRFLLCLSFLGWDVLVSAQ